MRPCPQCPHHSLAGVGVAAVDKHTKFDPGCDHEADAIADVTRGTVFCGHPRGGMLQMDPDLMLPSGEQLDIDNGGPIHHAPPHR